MEEWYRLEHPDEVDSPALLIYPNRVKRNIQEMIRIAGSPDRLMPHVKTHKMVEVTRLQIAAGIKAFKCATIAEAEMLAIAGASKILMAYQLNITKAERFARLIKKYPDCHFSSLVDNEESVIMLNDVYRTNSIHGTVYIDVDNGMHRTGIPVTKDITGFFAFLNTLSNVKCAGLHVYDGNIHFRDFEERKRAIQTAFEPVNKISQSLRKGGFHIEVIAGGSPSFTVHALNPEVVCSPGTNVFWDWGYSYLLPEQHFEYAAVLLTRVISKPVEGVITLDLGHKSVASENPIDKRVYLLNLNNYTPISQSEEHLVLKVSYKDWNNLSVGDVFYAIPYHICPTVALYEKVQTVENGKITGQWKVVARDRQITI